MVTMDNALQNQETDVCESVQLSHNINHKHSHYVSNQYIGEWTLDKDLHVKLGIQLLQLTEFLQSYGISEWKEKSLQSFISDTNNCKTSMMFIRKPWNNVT